MATIDQDIYDTPEPEGGGFEPIPAGDYKVIIEASEHRNTAKGGKMFGFQLQVIDGQHAGRKLFLNINHKCSTSQVAEEIGAQQFRELCDAVSVSRPKDTSELHNRPFTVQVIVKKHWQNEGEFQNEVKKIYTSTDQVAVAVGSSSDENPFA